MTTPQADALRLAAQAALDAIRDIAIDAATEIADDYHMKMARYRPLRHAALDKDVRTLRDVAESLGRALAAVPEPTQQCDGDPQATDQASTLPCDRLRWT